MEQEFQASSGTTAVDRAAELLTLVLAADGPRPLLDLAGEARLPKSTASRLLSALERHGLVAQQGTRGGFSAGPALLRFVNRGVRDRHLAELAGPAMQALSDASEETINLAVAGPLGVEHLAQVDSAHFIGAGQWVGRRVPFHCTANGKVLLAFGAAEMPVELERRTPHTLTDPDDLAIELGRVRGEGYATATDELEIGLSALAAPVFGAGGEAVAALSVSGPTLRLAPRRLAELRPVVIQQARALAELLGHSQKGVDAA